MSQPRICKHCSELAVSGRNVCHRHWAEYMRGLRNKKRAEDDAKALELVEQEAMTLKGFSTAFHAVITVLEDYFTVVERGNSVETIRAAGIARKQLATTFGVKGSRLKAFANPNRALAEVFGAEESLKAEKLTKPASMGGKRHLPDDAGLHLPDDVYRSDTVAKPDIKTDVKLADLAKPLKASKPDAKPFAGSAVKITPGLAPVTNDDPNGNPITQVGKPEYDAFRKLNVDNIVTRDPRHVEVIKQLQAYYLHTGQAYLDKEAFPVLLAFLLYDTDVKAMSQEDYYYLEGLALPMWYSGPRIIRYDGVDYEITQAEVDAQTEMPAALTGAPVALPDASAVAQATQEQHRKTLGLSMQSAGGDFEGDDWVLP